MTCACLRASPQHYSIIASTLFDISIFDDEFSKRMAAEKWRQLLEMRIHVRFFEGLFVYRDRIPEFFANNIILNKVATEAWRFEMLVYALYLYDTRDIDDLRSGLTLTNLQKICVEQKCASKGRVLAIVTMMRFAGYLRSTKRRGDNRVVLLEPTQAFISIVEGWNRCIFDVIDAIVPQGRLAQRHDANPRFGWDMRRRGAVGLINGWKLLDPFPEVAHFVSRDGGWMLLLTCVADSLRLGNFCCIAPVTVDLAAFGKRFGVSRSHLRRMLESAHATGLLDQAPKNGTNIVLAPRLVASFLNCMASELGYYNHHANAV
jgi:hypothetical protein